MHTPPLILIVDDEENFREIFGAKLSAAGFRVETAEGAKTGIAKATSLMPDLILMDVKMPGMEGSTAVMKLREDPAMKDVKIAFLTNLGDPRHLQEIDRKFSEEFGARDYLSKTDDLDVIIQRIKAILGQ
jgi:CheY-like chemotaxis protein